MSRDLSFLLDIWQAAHKIEKLIENVSQEEFVQDEMRHAAVIYQLIVVGEAAKRISNEFRQQNPAVPWKQMAGMRDVLIHSYDTIDLGLVWEAATQSIPTLIDQIEPLLPSIDEQ
ncbi:MAG: HepT-like ribonuclease domain-containing protein [Aggregatilineaceae bacterium]